MSRSNRNYRIATHFLRPLPEFIIIGAQKAGTTFLYETLGRHPQVRLADVKEVHFFDSLDFQKGPSWYRSHFPVRLYRGLCSTKQKARILTGEASPYYMIHPHAARRMAELVPDARLIVLLRNPVERAYSHYTRKSVRWESLSFEEAIATEAKRLEGEVEKMLADETYRSPTHKHFSYLLRGIYVDQLKAFEKYFPREQMLIIKSEAMFADPSQAYADVQSFLGLPQHRIENFKPIHANEYQDMKPETRRWLEEYFAPHNARLYEYLGEDFGW